MGSKRKVRQLMNLTIHEVALLRDAPYESPIHIARRRTTERMRADRLVALGLLERDECETGCLHRTTDAGEAEAAPLKTWEVEHAMDLLKPNGVAFRRLVKRLLIDASLAMSEIIRPTKEMSDARIGLMVVASRLGRV